MLIPAPFFPVLLDINHFIHSPSWIWTGVLLRYISPKTGLLGYKAYVYMFPNTDYLALCKQSCTYPLSIFFRIFLGYIHHGTRLYTIFRFIHMADLFLLMEWLPSLHSYQQWIKFHTLTHPSQNLYCLGFYAYQVIYHCYFICYFLNFCIWASLYTFAFTFPLIPITGPFLCPFAFGGSYLFSYGFRSTL